MLEEGEGGEGGEGGDGGEGEGGGGGGESTFAAGLSGELRNHPGLSKFADADAIGSSYLELEKALSKQGVRVPDAEAGPDHIAEYRRAIGVPDTVDGYKFEENVTVPEGLEWNGEVQKQMLDVMHQAGMTPEQVKNVSQAFLDQQGEMFTQAVTSAREAKTKAEQELKGEWGAAYEQNLEGATTAMKHLFKEEFKAVATTQLSDGTMLGNHPGFLKAMAEVGKDYAEHKLHGMGDRTRHTMTPKEAKMELDRLAADKDFQKVLFDKMDPGHKAAVDRRQNLYAMAAEGDQ
jgi:hypothetical protein